MMESTSDQRARIMECDRKTFKNEIINESKENMHNNSISGDQNCGLKEVKSESLTYSNKQLKVLDFMGNETISIPSIEVFTITGVSTQETDDTFKCTGINSVKLELDCKQVNLNSGDHNYRHTEVNLPDLPKNDYFTSDISIKEEKLQNLNAENEPLTSELEYPLGDIVDSSSFSQNNNIALKTPNEMEDMNKWYQNIKSTLEAQPEGDSTLQQTEMEYMVRWYQNLNSSLSKPEDESTVQQISQVSEGLISCNKCDFKCNLDRDFKIHKITFHQRCYPHTCDLCNYVSSKRIALEKHIKSKHENVINNMNIHVQSYLQEDFSVQQTLQISQELISCNKCDFKCPLHRDLKIHEITIHQRSYPHICELCNYVTAKRNALEKHIKSKHENTEINNMDIQEDSSVQQTFQISEELISCNKCNYKCHLYRDLKIHQITFHRKGNAYSCKLCKFVTAGQKTLEHHINVKHDKIRYPCEQCKKTFETTSNLALHVKSIHEGIKTHSCSLCDYKCDGPGRLRRHIEFVHEKLKKFFCDLCDFAHYYPIGLKYHVRNVHEAPKSRVCKECNKTFKTPANLRKHVRLVHQKIKKFACDLCKYKTYLSCLLKVHVNAVHNKLKEHLCQICGKKYGSSEYLKQHIAEVHVRKRPHVCSECGQAFIRKSHLKVHKWRMHRIGNQPKVLIYTCPECKKELSSQYSVTLHMQNKHGIDMDFKALDSMEPAWRQKPSECEYCHKILSNVHCLRQHILSVHEKLKPYQCPHCDHSCSLQSNMRLHIKTLHENKKRYNCHLCDFGCSSPFTIRRHIAEVHEKVTQKPYVCSNCEFSTFNKFNLKNHNKFVHSNSDMRKIPCHLCDMKFTKNHNLKKHISAVHHKLKPHKCGECGTAFAQIGNLRTHIKAVHDKIHTFTCTFCDYSASHHGNLKKHIAKHHKNMDSSSNQDTQDTEQINIKL